MGRLGSRTRGGNYQRYIGSRIWVCPKCGERYQRLDRSVTHCGFCKTELVRRD